MECYDYSFSRKTIEPWLFIREEHFKYNFQTIGKLFNDAIQLLQPYGVKYENVLLFVTDATPYIVKKSDSLTMLFPNMIHLKCLNHKIHILVDYQRQIHYN